MSEDKVELENGTPVEMAPQEDGTKVPLGSDKDVQPKFVASSNGDAKLDIGDTESYNGLTKAEVMKYADDPLWVKIRWILFTLFWVGWLVMLVAAIIIIVQAPRCEPPPELDWIQEAPMMFYDDQQSVDVSTDGKENDIVSVLESSGFQSIYIPSLIDPNDFTALHTSYSDAVLNVVKDVVDSGRKVVTDFFPKVVGDGHQWYQNDSYSEYFVSPGSQVLDFKNAALTREFEPLLDHWVSKGVSGFIMKNLATVNETEMQVSLNTYIKDKGGSVSSELIKVPFMNSGHELVKFIDQSVANASDLVNWKYYLYEPAVLRSDIEHLVTISLITLPGTPVMKVLDQGYNELKTNIKELMIFREKEAIKLGALESVEPEDEEVVAYIRVPIMKGMPGYAVALNFRRLEANVSFSGIPGIGEEATVEYISRRSSTDGFYSMRDKVPLDNVRVQGYEGLILQFVPRIN